MIALNSLIDQAYSSITMAGLGETPSGDMQVAAKDELNRLIASLNSQGYIAMNHKWKDMPGRRILYFKKLVEGETDPNVIDMEPPSTVVGVARRIGDRYIPLVNSNQLQMAAVNPSSTAARWTYGTDTEPMPEGYEGMRNVGVVTLDGDPRGQVRIWYNLDIPKYDLDDIIYLPDLYNELLLSGLCYRLACHFNLSPEKKADCKADFDPAKNLIKRNSASQRMFQSSTIAGDYRQSYQDGLAGNGF